MVNRCRRFFFTGAGSVCAHTDTAVVQQNLPVVVQSSAGAEIHTVAKHIFKRDCTVVFGFAFIQMHTIGNIFRCRILPAGNADIAVVGHAAVNAVCAVHTIVELAIVFRTHNNVFVVDNLRIFLNHAHTD